MTLSTISTFLHRADAPPTFLDQVIGFAQAQDAHLQVICAGIDATDPGFYYAGAQAMAVQHNLDEARRQLHDLEAQTSQRLEKTALLWDLEAVTMMSSSVAPFVSDHMRYCDLAVLPLPHAQTSSVLDIAAFEACMFGADIPVLLLPEDARALDRPARVMIAWDEGPEALSAARAALPLIRNAELTEICVIDPSPHSPDRSDPGGRLAQFLARQGARAEISVSARMQPDIAMQLLQRAQETGADLLVMGGYGHSRLREAVLGGVTRTVLRQAQLPVLMAR